MWVRRFKAFVIHDSFKNKRPGYSNSQRIYPFCQLPPVPSTIYFRVTSSTAQITDRWTLWKLLSKTWTNRAGDSTQIREDYHRLSGSAFVLSATVWSAIFDRTLQSGSTTFAHRRAELLFGTVFDIPLLFYVAVSRRPARCSARSEVSGRWSGQVYLWNWLLPPLQHRRWGYYTYIHFIIKHIIFESVKINTVRSFKQFVHFKSIGVK